MVKICIYRGMRGTYRGNIGCQRDMIGPYRGLICHYMSIVGSYSKSLLGKSLKGRRGLLHIKNMLFQICVTTSRYGVLMMSFSSILAKKIL